MIDPECVNQPETRCKYINPLNDKGRKKDPECAPESEIDEFVRTKTVKGRLLNPRIDFTLNDLNIRENEHFLPRVNLGNGWYTDQSFRFR